MGVEIWKYLLGVTCRNDCTTVLPPALNYWSVAVMIEIMSFTTEHEEQTSLGGTLSKG
jgi:hypothetical protein